MGKPPADLCGGRSVMSVPTAKLASIRSVGGGGVTKGGRSPTGVTLPPRRNFSASHDRGWPGSVGDFLRMENHLCAGSPCNRSSDEAFMKQFD